MTDSFYSQPITTTPNRTYELTFSENVNNPKQSKTSTNSLKFSKSTTIAAKGSPSKPRKKLKSYRKSESPSNKLLEFNFLNLILKFFQFIDNVLYYLVFFLCQLPLLLLKLVIIPIFGFSKKLTLWFKSQLKKPIKIPRFRSFQLYSTKFLVLDLDETLVRCTKERPTFECEEIVVIHKGNKVERYFLSKRPHLDHFFDELSKFYTFVVFTSSVKEYADIVINRIDNKKLIKHRYYRESCIKEPNGYIKDLSVTKLPLDRVIMIDNSKIAFKFNEENAIHIEPWLGLNENDNELEQLLILLLGLIKETGDIRISLKTFKKENINRVSSSEVNSIYDEDPIDFN